MSDDGTTTTSTESNAGTNTGRIIEIKGVVIDAVFADSLPEIYTALASRFPRRTARHER